MQRITIIATFLLALATPALAQTEAGVIKTSRGTAHISRGAQTLPAEVGATLLVNDSVVTGTDSAVGITLKDNTRLTAGPNTTLDMNKFSFNSTTNTGTVDASVKRGSLAVISGKIAKGSPEGVRFKTPTVTLGVRGTEFIIEVGE